MAANNLVFDDCHDWHTVEYVHHGLPQSNAETLLHFVVEPVFFEGAGSVRAGSKRVGSKSGKRMSGELVRVEEERQENRQEEQREGEEEG